jgi:hypothetical protein
MSLTVTCILLTDIELRALRAKSRADQVAWLEDQPDQIDIYEFDVVSEVLLSLGSNAILTGEPEVELPGVYVEPSAVCAAVDRLAASTDDSLAASVQGSDRVMDQIGNFRGLIRTAVETGRGMLILIG